MPEDKILEWAQLAVRNENFAKQYVKVLGKTKRGDGYFGKVTFVTVVGTTTSGNKKVINLAIKSSAPSKRLRRQVPMKELFRKEIFIYNQVIPAFNRFQQSIGVEDEWIDLLPTCYVTQNMGNYETIILENIKEDGYEMWNRHICMPFDYISLVLQAYAKWHALSFALQQKKPESFQQLVKSNTNMLPEFFIKTGAYTVIFDYFEQIKNYCKYEVDVSQLGFSQEYIKDILTRFFEEESDRVVLHGDCWTNNYLFKEEESGKPGKICIIDWQLSGMGSPILDLTMFIYACVDTEVYKDVKDLLKIYHENLSEYLEEFGCNIDEIFSFKKVLQHWKKYSSFGLLISTFLLKFSLCESGESPDFAESADLGKEFLENFKFTIANEKEFLRRGKNNIVHYIKNMTF